MLLLLFTSSALSGPLEAGLYEQSIRAMNQMLSTQDQPPLWARLGSALSRAGHYSDALAAFDSGKGLYYESGSLADHATALRGVGRCEEALALRRSALLVAPDEAKEIALYVGLVDDALLCNQPQRAIDTGWEGLSLSPESASLHAALSDAYRTIGAVDDADWHLMLAGDLDPRAPRLLLAQLQALAAEKRWGELSAVLQRIDGPLARDPAVFVATVQLASVQGRMRDMLQLCQEVAWRDHEDKTVRALRQEIYRRLGLAPDESLGRPGALVPDRTSLRAMPKLRP